MTDRIKKILMGLAALAALGVGASAIAGATSGGKGAATQERSEASEGAKENEASEAAEGKESDKGDRGEHSGKPVTGAAASRAKEAAAAKTGGKPGVVERDNEKGSAYEVEVTKANGQKVDVRLDDQSKVVGVDEDHEGGEQEGAGK